MKMVTRIPFFVLLFLTCAIQAQTERGNPIPPDNPREADVMFSKRVWRVIDLREKQNKPITWPKANISKIIYNSIMSGGLKPYKDDSLHGIFDLEVFVKRGSNKIVVRKLVDPNDNDGLYTTDTIFDPFDPEEKITQLMLMEELYYDKKMSREVVRIIAIAPLFNWEVEGYSLGMQPLCWLKYYDRNAKEMACRDLFVKQILFNPMNSRSTFSFDDWFEQRRFGSFIVKTSNFSDISIMDDPEVKKNGLKALIEAERLKQDLHERDMNNYEY